MRKIAVFVACILFYASVAPIVASTSEIAEARIAGENDTKGFYWQWFSAGYLSAHASPILLLSAIWFIEEFSLDGILDNISPSHCAAGIRNLSTYTHSVCPDPLTSSSSRPSFREIT